MATSDIEDLELLKEVTVTISRIQDACTFGSNLYRLLSELVSLCANLHDIQPSELSHNQNIQDQSSPTSGSLGDGNFSKSFEKQVPTSSPVGDVTSRPQLQQENQQSDDDRLCERPKTASVWDEGLMWELFNTHPSVEWFDYHSSSF